MDSRTLKPKKPKKVKDEDGNEVKVEKVKKEKPPGYLALAKGKTRPMMPGSGYKFYLWRNYRITREEFPELAPTEICKYNINKWKTLSEEERAPYQ